MKFRKRILAMLLLSVILLLLCGCVAKEKTAAPEQPSAQTAYSSPEDLAGKKIGVVTGTIFDQVLEKHIPDVKIEYYNATPDLPVALDSGKIDGYMVDQPIMRVLVAENPTQRCLGTVEDDQYGYIFPKTERGVALRDQFNEFLAKIKADGTLAEIDALWFGDDETKKVVDVDSLTGENGTLGFSASFTMTPFAYIKDGKMVGYEFDIAVRFCREYGYALNISDTTFAGVVASVTSGKSDFGAASISITEERKESMYFSDPDYIGGMVLVVKGGDSSASEQPSAQTVYSSLEDLAGKKIGVLTGSIFDKVAQEKIPGIQPEYLNAMSDMPVALQADKIDAYLIDEPIFRNISRNYPEEYIIDQLTYEDYAFLFPKNSERHEKICAELNEFLAESWENGTMQEISDKWITGDTETARIDFTGLTGENGTLKMAVSSELGMPFTFMKNNEFAGYDIEVIVRFCRDRGYALELSDYSISGMLTATSAGKADIAGGCVSITEERKESILFSEPDYHGGIVLIGMKGGDSLASEQPSAQTAYSSPEDLAGKKIGVLTGTRFDEVAANHIKDCQLEYFNTIADNAMALEAGKVDAYLVDEPVARTVICEYPTQRCLAVLEDEQYGFVFPKTEQGVELRDRFNEFLAKIKTDGTLEKVDEIWFGDDEAQKVVELDSLTGENGTLRFVTESGTPPFVYMKDGRIVGYEVDLAVRFCREYGYRLEIADTVFSGVLASVSSGKCDFSATCIAITEERKESMCFSDPDYIGGIVLVVKDSVPVKDEASGGINAAEEDSASGIAESFEKTFLRESRWKLFVNGIGITLLITLLSTVFGTALGFGIYMLYRKNYKPFNVAVNLLMDILEKTPVVVILMILYYIAFGKSNLKGVWVSVIGFSIMFACTFVGTLKIGVMAVDQGQTEASLALGFTDRRSFLRVIFPQAAKHFLPNYKGQIVSLLKDTAVVGYIAVQDLTKVGDIVRSRTYEAFFPLVATAVIYFLLAWLLTRLVQCIEFRTDPTRRSREKILKGVETK